VRNIRREDEEKYDEGNSSGYSKDWNPSLSNMNPLANIW